MIGLSLSFCIKDIFAGKVSEWDVSKIVTNTRCVTEEDWEKLFTQYWKDFDGAAVCALIKRFRALGKIEQPRLGNPEYGHSISNGHWISNDAPIPLLDK